MVDVKLIVIVVVVVGLVMWMGPGTITGAQTAGNDGSRTDGGANNNQEPSQDNQDRQQRNSQDSTGGGGAAPTLVCGNGILDEGEQCDDGNDNNRDDCSTECKKIQHEPRCGNGVVEKGEQCDDGPRNGLSGSVCMKNCLFEEDVERDVCGNGIIENGEQCDFAGGEPFVLEDGERVLFDEACNGIDPKYYPNDLVMCHTERCVFDTRNCRWCGDSRIQPEHGEECDDGNEFYGDGCTPFCDREIVKPVAEKPGKPEPSPKVPAPTPQLPSEPLSEIFDERPGTRVEKIVSRTRALKRVEIIIPDEQAVIEVRETLSSETPVFLEKTYQAFEAKTVGTVEEAESAFFEFAVEKRWVEEQGVSPDDIALYRYATTWEYVVTALVDEDDVFYYYESISPGLSFFVISVRETPIGITATTQVGASEGESALAAAQRLVADAEASGQPTEERPAARPKGQRTTGGAGLTALLMLFLLVIVGGGAFMMFKRPMARESPRIRSTELEEVMGELESALGRNEKQDAQHLLARAQRIFDDSEPSVRTQYASRLQAAFKEFR